jgi:WD40 repeat protein
MKNFINKLLLVVASIALTQPYSQCMYRARSLLELDHTLPTLPKEIWRSILFLALKDTISEFKYYGELKGHIKLVNTAIFSPDATLALTASFDYTARLWDVKTGEQLQVFNGHTNAVASAVFSPDGKLVLTASSDNTARLWDVKTGIELQVFNRHTSSVYSAVFSPDGTLVLTGSCDKTSRLWDIKTGIELQVFNGHTSSVYSAVFSPDGTLVLTGSYDNTARLWDIKTGEQLQVFKGHTEAVYSAVFSPYGTFVLTGSRDKTARLWRRFSWDKETKELFVNYYQLMCMNLNKELRSGNSKHSLVGYFNNLILSLYSYIENNL